MKKYIVEFIGTFFLVLCIGLVVIEGELGALAPLPIGAMLMVVIYAGGHISGAHYNPAVTLAVWMRGKCPKSDVLPYMFFQIAGAALAAMVVSYLKGSSMPETALTRDDVPRALIAEFLGTFLLAYVVLNVATSKNTAGNSFYGLAIGFTVLTCAFALGSYSGGAFNPAVAIVVCIMKLSSWVDLWIFIVACFGGAALAAVVFNWLNPDEVIIIKDKN